MASKSRWEDKQLEKKIRQNSMLAGIYGCIVSWFFFVLIRFCCYNMLINTSSVLVFLFSVIFILMQIVFAYLILSKCEKLELYHVKESVYLKGGFFISTPILLYGLLNNDINADVDVTGFFWHIIPEFVVVCLATFLGCGIMSLVKKKREWLSNVWLYIYYTVMALVYAGTAVYINCFSGDLYHVDAYMHPIYNIYYGQAYSDLSYGIYGHYELFYVLFMKILGTSPLVICGCLYLIAVVSALCFELTLHKLLKSQILKVLLPIALLVPTGCMFKSTSYQSTPHRIFFPLVLVYMVTSISHKKNIDWKDRLRGLILCTISVVWNTESGIICCVGWMIFCIIKYLQNKNVKISILLLRVFQEAILVLLEIALAVLLVNVYNLFHHGGFFIKEFFYPYINNTFIDHYIIPIKYGNYPYVYMGLLGIMALVYAVSRTKLFGYQDNSRYGAAVATIGVLLLGELTYYIARATYYALIIAYPFALLLLGWVADKAENCNNRKEINQYDGIKNGIAYSCIVALSLLCIMSTSITESYAQFIEGHHFSVPDLKKEIDQVKMNIPSGTYALGWGTDEIYGLLNWDTGYHFLGTSDVLLDQKANCKVMEKLLNEVNSQENVLLGQAAYSEYPVLNKNYTLSKELIIFGKKYGFFVRDDYKKSKLHEKISENDSSIIYYIDGVTRNEDYFSINGWAYMNGENLDTKEKSQIGLGIINVQTENVLEIDTEPVMRKDVTESFGEGNNYDYSGFYGRIANDEMDMNQKYEIVLLLNNNSVIKRTGVYLNE